jgi:hypothetical protein
MDFKNLKKTICEPKLSRLLPIFVISNKKIHRLRYGFKILQKIYRLAYGLLFFVISISGRFALLLLLLLSLLQLRKPECIIRAAAGYALTVLSYSCIDFLVYFFGGLECVGRFFAYVAYL